MPAKLAARVRLFDTGHNRKTDALDAHSIAVVAVRTAGLRVVAEDGELEALRMLTDRRDELAHQRVQTVNRLQRLLSELLPGQRKRDLSAAQAKAMLATVRPRDIAGKTRRRMAAEEIADLVARRREAEEDQGRAEGRSHRARLDLMDLYGVGPAGAARVLADVGDVARFVDRNRFASWTGTAPLDASSGEQTRHRLSRAGNRRMNHVLHVAAIVQIRHDTEGRAYYRRKLAAGKTPMEALRCLKRRLSDVVYRQLVADAERTQQPMRRVREGTAGRLKNPARPTHTRSSTLRISHFPDPQTDATPTTTRPEDPHSSRALTQRGARSGRFALSQSVWDHAATGRDRKAPRARPSRESATAEQSSSVRSCMLSARLANHFDGPRSARRGR